MKFEPGSDMENLILKYNIGNVSGLQEYTIDAIKYVDGELIKDVKMQGDQTVRVEVNGGNGTLTLRAESEFETIAFTTEWAKNFTGTRDLVTLEIYENDTLLRSLSPDTRKISGLPLGKRLLLKASYMDGETKKTVAHVFKTPSSEGLKMVDGEIVGMGTCTDPILYFDAPITGPLITEATQLNYVTEVYFTKNVTFIRGAFESDNLKKVVLGEGFSLPLGYGNFPVPSGPNLTDVTIPVSVTELGQEAIGTEQHLNIWYGGTKAQWDSVKKYYGNEPYDPTCNYEPSIKARSYTIHCSDGTIDVVYNETTHTATIRYN